jgi:hypothetical protein
LINCGLAPSTVMIFNFSPSFRFQFYRFMVIYLLFDIGWGFSCISKLFFDRTDGVYFTVPGFRVAITGGEFNGTDKPVACLTIAP